MPSPNGSGSPRIDHVSVAATTESISGLGLRLAPTPEAHDHARVFLERGYLEITPPDAVGAGPKARGWYLGVPDLERAVAGLKSREIEVSGPARYDGHDGTWLDLTIRGGSRLLPCLTRRLDVPVADWPPPLDSGQPHPNGAMTFAELRLSCSEADRVASVLAALDADDLGAGRWALADGCTVAIVPVSSRAHESLGVVLTGRDGLRTRIELST